MGKDYRSRKGDDNVYTPYSMTEQLLENEYFDKENPVYDPAIGNGAITTVLERYWPPDIVGGNDIKYGHDFLSDINRKLLYNVYTIITNPPYSLWNEFIEKSRKIAIKKFAFLGQLNFLNGVDRYEKKLYSPGKYNLKKLYVFTRQANLKFYDQEKEIKKAVMYCESNYAPKDINSQILKLRNDIKKKTHYPKIRIDGKYPAGAVVYAWYVFENGYSGKAEIDFINNDKYILRSCDFKK